MTFFTNKTHGTHPLVIHAPGPEFLHPQWPRIRDRCFAQPRQSIGAIPGLTILTWNNGNPAMGVLERSLDHLGIPYLVTGQGIDPWVNSRDKPRLTCEALAAIDTPYVLGVDSGDAVIIDHPGRLLDALDNHFRCDLVFNAGKINWPHVEEFKHFEESLPGAAESEHHFLNGGVWIGRTEFCREFFGEALRTAPIAHRGESEQGILKQLFPRYHPRVQLDYKAEIFQNVGFMIEPIFQLAD